MATNYVVVPKTVDNYDPNLKTQLLSGQGNPPAPQSPGITDQQRFQLSQFQGYKGDFDAWSREQAGYAEQAKKDMAANPGVVAGGYTPQSQSAAVTKPVSAGIVGSQTATGSGDIESFVRGLNWDASNESGAVGSVYGAAQKNGWSAKQIGDAMGFTEQQVLDAYKKHGYGSASSGIVGSQVNGGQFQPWEVTSKQTVQQQAADIIAKDSPLMQQARGRAMQQMNERGLINSSLGVQAAQDAVMERALQIAQPDAATNAQAAQFNANQGNAWNLAQQEMEYKRWALSQNFENEKQLREIESKYNEELGSDANFQKQYAMYLDALFQIEMNTELDAETKLAMKKQRGQELDDYIAINKLGIDMDFSDYWAPKQASAPAPSPTAPAPAPYVDTSGG